MKGTSDWISLEDAKAYGNHCHWWTCKGPDGSQVSFDLTNYNHRRHRPVLRYSNGDMYAGGWRRNSTAADRYASDNHNHNNSSAVEKPDGYGVFLAVDGLLLAGHWKNGHLQGKAKQLWLPHSQVWRTNRDVESCIFRTTDGLPFLYLGEFVDSQKHDGQAIVILKDGTARVGRWRNDRPVGNWWHEHRRKVVPPSKLDNLLQFAALRNPTTVFATMKHTTHHHHHRSSGHVPTTTTTRRSPSPSESSSSAFAAYEDDLDTTGAQEGSTIQVRQPIRVFDASYDDHDDPPLSTVAVPVASPTADASSTASTRHNLCSSTHTVWQQQPLPQQPPQPLSSSQGELQHKHQKGLIGPRRYRVLLHQQQRHQQQRQQQQQLVQHDQQQQHSTSLGQHPPHTYTEETSTIVSNDDIASNLSVVGTEERGRRERDFRPPPFVDAVGLSVLLPQSQSHNPYSDASSMRVVLDDDDDDDASGSSMRSNNKKNNNSNNNNRNNDGNDNDDPLSLQVFSDDDDNDANQQDNTGRSDENNDINNHRHHHHHHEMPQPVIVGESVRSFEEAMQSSLPIVNGSTTASPTARPTSTPTAASMHVLVDDPVVVRGNSSLQDPRSVLALGAEPPPDTAEDGLARIDEGQDDDDDDDDNDNDDNEDNDTDTVNGDNDNGDNDDDNKHNRNYHHDDPPDVNSGGNDVGIGRLPDDPTTKRRDPPTRYSSHLHTTASSTSDPPSSQHAQREPILDPPSVVVPIHSDTAEQQQQQQQEPYQQEQYHQYQQQQQQSHRHSSRRRRPEFEDTRYIVEIEVNPSSEAEASAKEAPPVAVLSSSEEVVDASYRSGSRLEKMSTMVIVLDDMPPLDGDDNQNQDTSALQEKMRANDTPMAQAAPKIKFSDVAVAADKLTKLPTKTLALRDHLHIMSSDLGGINDNRLDFIEIEKRDDFVTTHIPPADEESRAVVPAGQAAAEGDGTLFFCSRRRGAIGGNDDDDDDVLDGEYEDHVGCSTTAIRYLDVARSISNRLNSPSHILGAMDGEIFDFTTTTGNAAQPQPLQGPGLLQQQQQQQQQQNNDGEQEPLIEIRSSMASNNNNNNSSSSSSNNNQAATKPRSLTDLLFFGCLCASS